MSRVNSNWHSLFRKSTKTQVSTVAIVLASRENHLILQGEETTDRGVNPVIYYILKVVLTSFSHVHAWRSVGPVPKFGCAV